jgi:hypothetical protein
LCALVTDDDDDAVGGNGGNVSELNLLLVLLTPIRVDRELLLPAVDDEYLLSYFFLSPSSKS